MNLVIATSIYPPEIGRPSTYIKELAEHLSKHHHVSIVAYTDTKHLNNNIKLAPINKQLPFFIRLISFSFALWQVSKKADILYVQNAMSAGLPATIVSAIRGVPFVIAFIGDEVYERAYQKQQTRKGLEDFLSDPDGGWKIKLMTLIQTFVLKRAKGIITSTTYIKHLIEKTYQVNPKKIIVHMPPLEKPETLPFQTPRKLHNIVVISKTISLEMINILIAAFIKIRERYSDAELTIANKNIDMEFLRHLEINETIKKGVTLVGKIPRTEVWALLKEAGVYVHEQDDLYFPYQILKSFAVGTPVIALETGTSKEIIDEKKTGLLLKTLDIPLLTQALEQMFKNSNSYNELKALHSSSIEKKFSWESHLNKLMNIFKSIILKPLNIV